MPTLKSFRLPVAAATLLAAIMVCASLVIAKPTEVPRFAYTETFTASEIFYDYCVGFACRPTEQFAAAKRAVAAGDPAIVPYLEARFDVAPRAGQFYIALVIRAYDPAKGEKLLHRLADEEGEVRVFSGCELAPERLDRLAISYLRKPGFRFGA
jgi:hypothetical protein